MQQQSLVYIQQQPQAQFYPAQQQQYQPQQQQFQGQPQQFGQPTYAQGQPQFTQQPPAYQPQYGAPAQHSSIGEHSPCLRAMEKKERAGVSALPDKPLSPMEVESATEMMAQPMASRLTEVTCRSLDCARIGNCCVIQSRR
jgi:hypothetical protein